MVEFEPMRIEIRTDGRTQRGYYVVEDGVLTVACYHGRKSARVADQAVTALARQLLADLLRGR